MVILQYCNMFNIARNIAGNIARNIASNIARCGCLYSRNFQTSVARNLLSVDGFAIHLPAILPVPPILLAILLDVDACLGEPPSTQ